MSKEGQPVFWKTNQELRPRPLTTSSENYASPTRTSLFQVGILVKIEEGKQRVIKLHQAIEQGESAWLKFYSPTSGVILTAPIFGAVSFSNLRLEQFGRTEKPFNADLVCATIGLSREQEWQVTPEDFNDPLARFFSSRPKQETFQNQS
ncbi:hypothetical protein ACFL0Y_00870 [Patescibacteria group bacterium]